VVIELDRYQVGYLTNRRGSGLTSRTSGHASVFHGWTSSNRAGQSHSLNSAATAAPPGSQTDSSDSA
jgi:hypothetical protein